MKAEIDKNGMLVIKAENASEYSAIREWFFDKTGSFSTQLLLRKGEDIYFEYQKDDNEQT